MCNGKTSHCLLNPLIKSREGNTFEISSQLGDRSFILVNKYRNRGKDDVEIGFL